MSSSEDWLLALAASELGDVDPCLPEFADDPEASASPPDVWRADARDDDPR